MKDQSYNMRKFYMEELVNIEVRSLFFGSWASSQN
jgi:hypothetical protein